MKGTHEKSIGLVLILNFRLFSKTQLDYNLHHFLIKSVQLHYVFCLYPALSWRVYFINVGSVSPYQHFKPIQLQKHLTRLTAVSFLAHICPIAALNLPLIKFAVLQWIIPSANSSHQLPSLLLDSVVKPTPKPLRSLKFIFFGGCCTITYL